MVAQRGQHAVSFWACVTCKRCAGMRARALAPLLEWAEAVVPPRQWARTPLFLFGTAGLRRLPAERQATVLAHARSALRASRFRCPLTWRHAGVPGAKLSFVAHLHWLLHGRQQLQRSCIHGPRCACGCSPACLLPPMHALLPLHDHSTTCAGLRHREQSELLSRSSCVAPPSTLPQQPYISWPAADRLQRPAAGRFQDGWARVISGADEGVFGWIALNYLADRLMTVRPALPAPGASSGSPANAPSGPVAARVAAAGGATSAEGIFGRGEGLDPPQGR